MKKLQKSGTLIRVLLAAASLLAFTVNSKAQTLVYSQDFDIDHSQDGTFVTNISSGGTHFADTFFDYSTIGIPVAPHTTGGTTRGLKMSADLGPVSFFGGVSVSPIGFAITENFVMHFDCWQNFNGPLPGGGSGSTQVGGAGYGTAGTAPQVAGVADSVYIGTTGDGGSSADYRVYGSYHPISYQDGSFRVGSDGTNATTSGDPSSGLVYAGTNRNNTFGNYYTSQFPGQSPPAAQTALFAQQSGTAAAGSQAFKWHDVALQKIANVITYSIDGVLIATVDVVDAGPLGGNNILWNCYDISAGASADPDFLTLNFTLIDNVRVTNFPNVVSVTAANGASIAEGNSTPAVFAITRTSSGTPLTVNYTMTGTASNGVDYTDLLGSPLSGSVTFAANATTTNISVKAFDDSIAELTETIVLNVNPSVDYTGAGNATIRIVDNETPELTITNLSKQMFKRTNDFATFQISRLGNTNTVSFPVNLSFSGGSAVYGTDFYTNVVVTFEPGASTTNINIYPIEDTTFKGDLTATLNIAAGGTNYNIGTQNSASIAIVAAVGPPETILFQDNLHTDTSGSWTTLTVANDGTPDNTVVFGFDYNDQNIPSAPHSAGDTHGLFVTVNKLDTNASAAAVNFYPNGQSFSGNYALRFDMWLNIITNSTITTEYALAGLNHSGTKTNWWRSGGVPAGWTFDGVFYAIETDGQASPTYVNYSSPITTNNNPTALTAGTNAAGFTSVFKSPPWTVAGAPAGTSAATGTPGPPPWSEVELSQIGGVQTLRINNSKIFSYTNTTPYQSGNIMIGFEDAFDSVGDAHTYAVFANLRVVRLTAPNITAIQVSGGTAAIDFTSDAGLVAGQYVLQAASVVTGPYTDVVGTVTQPTSGNFHVTAAVAGNMKYFRVRRVF